MLFDDTKERSQSTPERLLLVWTSSDVAEYPLFIFRNPEYGSKELPYDQCNLAINPHLGHAGGMTCHLTCAGVVHVHACDSTSIIQCFDNTFRVVALALLLSDFNFYACFSFTILHVLHVFVPFTFTDLLLQLYMFIH